MARYFKAPGRESQELLRVQQKPHAASKTNDANTFTRITLVKSCLFQWKKSHYLIIVDYFSRYIEISKLSQLTADAIVTHTKSIFATHGIPEVVYSDNGQQFSSEAYKQFALAYQFKQVTSSPYFPHSNGEAKKAVGTIKSLLRKEENPYLALLAYRSTPLAIGYSLAKLLMSRRLHPNVPMTRQQRKSEISDSNAVRER